MRTVFPLASVLTMVLLAALAVGAVGAVGLATALLPELPAVAGGLLAAGAALGAWAGWKAGLARRPRPAVVAVPVRRPDRRRRSR